jgi:hypothetical protein
MTQAQLFQMYVDKHTKSTGTYIGFENLFDGEVYVNFINKYGKEDQIHTTWKSLILMLPA